MKYHATFATLAAFAAFAAAPATAAESDASETGPYLGIGYAYLNHEDPSNTIADSSTQGFVLRGGVNLGELVDLEVDYGQTGGEVRVFRTNVDTDFSAWGVSLLLAPEMDGFVKPFARIGHRWIDFEVGAGGFSGSDDYEEVVYGVGLRWAVGDSIFFRGEYEWITDHDGGLIVALEWQF